MEEQQSWEQQQRTNAQAQPARGPCETPAQQPASEHGDAADQHAEASQVLESMQHGQDIEAQLDEVMQDADDADVAVQFAEADNPEQHAGMCQPGCSEAFGQAATGHEHQLGQDVPDSQQHTGGAGTSGRLNAANLQPPLRDLHLTGHVHDELAAAQPQVPPYSFDEARQLMLSHHAQRTLKSLAALPAEETEKPWQLPCHSFRHDVMACCPAPMAFDVRQYMPELTPVTGAEAALEWRNERIRYWQSLRTPKTVARHEKMAEAVEQAASRGPRKQSAGHRMVALARDKMKFNLLHQRQRLRRGSPLRLPQLRGWMPFGLMRHRGLKRPVFPSSAAAQPISAQAIAPAHQCSPIPVLSGRCDNALCLQALCVPSSCAFDDALWVLSRSQLSRPSIAGGAPAEVYILDRTRGRKIPGKVVQSMRNTVAPKSPRHAVVCEGGIIREAAEVNMEHHIADERLGSIHVSTGCVLHHCVIIVMHHASDSEAKSMFINQKLPR